MIGRRQFLSVAAGGVALGGLPVTVRPAHSAQSSCGSKTFAHLPKISLDLERSISQRTLIPEGGKRLEDYPGGVHLILPSAVRIPMGKWVWRSADQAGGHKVKLMISSPDPMRPTLLEATGEGEPLRVYAAPGRDTGLAFRNLNIRGAGRVDAFRPDGLSQLWMDRVTIQGGRNCMMLPFHPTRALIENCSFFHGGFGDGYTHNVYINYVAEVVIRNCRFHSPRRLGHALKCYAARSWIEDSYFASYENEEDLDQGYSGELPLLDMGAWGHSVIRGNLFRRRGPSREVVIDYRNRQWRAKEGPGLPEDWGTKVIPHEQIDNRDRSSKGLFHHLLMDNRFENGIRPDGTQEGGWNFPAGSVARNNGTAPWNSHGGSDPAWWSRIANWQPHHERAILWHRGNRFSGKPFEKNFLANPFEISDLTTPIREVGVDEASNMARIRASEFNCLN